MDKKRNGIDWYLVFAILLTFLAIGFIRHQNDNTKPGRGMTAPAPTLASTPIPISQATPAITDRDWNSLMPLPDMSSVEAFNAASNNRSPYVVGAMSPVGSGLYTEYSVDFKADFVPTGTYCCLANMALDYSSSFKKTRTDYEGVNFYAGFQRVNDGRMISIMSVWDLYVSDSAGNERVIHAHVVAPEAYVGGSFSGEGTGVQCLVDYPWQPGHWYRMLIQCGISEETGNTTLEQLACDLEAGIWTSLCKYDLGVPGVRLKGSPCVFLECFEYGTAGNVRTMECRNFRVRGGTSGNWHDMQEAYLQDGYPYPGSFTYGSDGECLYFITSGLPGMVIDPGDFKVKIRSCESGQPY